MTIGKLAATLCVTALMAIPQGAAAFKCMPVYGNWCGIDYPASGSLPPPIDGFDRACMHHDFCASRWGSGACDIAFAGELRTLAIQHGHLPRPLQWAEYLFRVKAGGPWGGMPMPTPGDALGILSSLASPCW